MGKLIVKTALITFLIIVVLIGAVGGMFIWLAPESVATSCESLGFETLSMQMYEKAYKKDKTINNLHRVVDKAILFGSDKTLLKYYPILEAHKNYDRFIEALDNANYDENAKVIVNLKLSNEDNRLKTRYVAALAESDFSKAFDYAKAEIYNADLAGEKINFCIIGLAQHITDSNVSNFTDVAKGIDDISVCDIIADHYISLKSRYEIMSGTNYQKAVVSGKLVDMIQFMLLIESKTTDSGYDKTALTNDLEAIFAEYKEYIS